MSGTISHAGRSRHTAVVLIVLAVACVVAGVTAILAGTTGGGSPPPQPDTAAGQMPHHMSASGMPASGMPAPTADVTASPTRSSDPRVARPTALDIPSIGVHTTLLDLGLNKDGTLEVPDQPLRAGWFHGSPSPGQTGPAVILGHVDSRETGPAVFYRLGAMKPHERIRVTRADHTTAAFTVDAVRSYEKKAFPTLEVYGNTPDPELRLITCSDWNARTRSYEGNTVVYAHLDR